MNMNTEVISPTSPSLRATAKFKGQILRKVYRVWLLRKFTPVIAIELLVMTFLINELGHVVFVQRIIENATNVLFAHPRGFIGFIVAMFTNASTGERFLGISIIVFVAITLRHLTQGLLRWILVKENYFEKTV